MGYSAYWYSAGANGKTGFGHSLKGFFLSHYRDNVMICNKGVNINFIFDAQ